MSVNFCRIDILRSARSVRKNASGKPVHRVLEVRKGRANRCNLTTNLVDKKKDSCELGRMIDELFNPSLYYRL